LFEVEKRNLFFFEEKVAKYIFFLIKSTLKGKKNAHMTTDLPVIYKIKKKIY
jgi:mRNA-degrading endonuclease YafQ of YafQ-DinJ toxin-antitoxin module